MKHIIRKILKEFVDVKDILLYHGTANDFENFDIEKSGTVQYGDWGKGIYLTKSKAQANQYRIDAVKKMSEEYNQAYEDYEQTYEQFKNAKFETQEKKELDSLSNIKLKKFQDIGKKLNTTKEGKIIVVKVKPSAKIYKYDSGDITDPYLAEEVKSKGYDIALIDEGRWTEEYLVVNPDSIEIVDKISTD